MTNQGEAKYRKLARNIFLASDHLLTRSRSMFSEYYKRFYFNEIQYIILQRTAGWHFRGVLLVVLLTIDMELILGVARSVVALVVGVSIAVLGAGLHFLAGPSCRVIVKTPLGAQRLHGATSVRRAKKIIQRLNEEITKVQGPLQVEQIAATQAQAAQGMHTSNPAEQSQLASEALGDLENTAGNSPAAAPTSSAPAPNAAVASAAMASDSPVSGATNE